MNMRVSQTDWSTNLHGVGKSLPRKEDETLVRGAGCYTDDLSLEGQLYAAFVRSPHAHGLIRGIDTRDASAMKAVGEAALGINVTSHWNTDFDNAANKKFMEAWTKKYNRPPTYYASQGYDTALAIGAGAEGDRRQGRRHRSLPQGHAEGGLQVGARQLQVRPEPAPGSGLVRAQGREGGRRHAES